MVLQMIVHQNNEGRRSGPQYVIVNIPVILSFIFSHPLGFNPYRTNVENRVSS